MCMRKKLKKLQKNYKKLKKKLKKITSGKPIKGKSEVIKNFNFGGGV